MGLKNQIQFFFRSSFTVAKLENKATHFTHVTTKLHNTERKRRQLMTDVRYDTHMAHSSHITSALTSVKNNMQTLSAFNVRGFHAGRAQV